MKEKDLFNLVYNDEHSYLGLRISSHDIKYSNISTKTWKEIVSKLFIEVPPKFEGESKYERYFLLKKKWQVYRQLRNIIELSKRHPHKRWFYIKHFIKFVFELNKDFKFYMNPEKIK